MMLNLYPVCTFAARLLEDNDRTRFLCNSPFHSSFEPIYKSPSLLLQACRLASGISKFSYFSICSENRPQIDRVRRVFAHISSRHRLDVSANISYGNSTCQMTTVHLFENRKSREMRRLDNDFFFSIKIILYRNSAFLRLTLPTWVLDRHKHRTHDNRLWQVPSFRMDLAIYIAQYSWYLHPAPANRNSFVWLQNELKLPWKRSNSYLEIAFAILFAPSRVVNNAK